MFASCALKRDDLMSSTSHCGRVRYQITSISFKYKNLNFCITHNFKKDDMRLQGINLSFSLSLDSATMIQNCH